MTALGFGRADLVVAAPKSWIDVDTMADVDEVAHLYLARTGRRLRVATKYLLQTRQFFARHGVADYRLAESGGATEGAPAAGAAELVVDITTTGATLAANGLKVLDDGLILSSQAHVAAGLTAPVGRGGASTSAAGCCRSSPPAREARPSPASRGRRASTIAPEPPSPGSPCPGDSVGPSGVLVDGGDLFAANHALARAGVGPVSVSQPAFVFEATNAAVDRLEARLSVA